MVIFQSKCYLVRISANNDTMDIYMMLLETVDPRERASSPVVFILRFNNIVLNQAVQCRKSAANIDHLAVNIEPLAVRYFQRDLVSSPVICSVYLIINMLKKN